MEVTWNPETILKCMWHVCGMDVTWMWHGKWHVKGSHDSKFKTSKDKMHADNEIINEYGSNNIIELKGQKGYTFIADTFGFHKGLPPTENNRLVLQIIYTLKRTPFSPKKPFISNDDAINLCSNPYSKYVNRNIIKI